MPARVTEGALTENDALLLLRCGLVSSTLRMEGAYCGKDKEKHTSDSRLGREKKMRGVQRGEHEELVERRKGRSERLTRIGCQQTLSCLLGQ